MFDKVYCINLDRRPDRWEQFLEGLPNPWPFEKVERISAIDGKKCPRPKWFLKGGAGADGAWGCYMTHFSLLQNALNKDIDSFLVFEDDAVFIPRFVDLWKQYSSEIPEDWQMLYLGGQHLHAPIHPPKKIDNTNLWYKPYNVNRTHAMAFRGKEFMKKMYLHLLRQDWHPTHHVDWHIGRLIQRREDAIYTPDKWLVGQREGKSDIINRKFPSRFFPPASSYEGMPKEPFVFILGLHRSGSSLVAKICKALGVHMGNHLVGYEGPNEPKGLMDICEKHMPFPTMEVLEPVKLKYKLERWVKSRQGEVLNRSDSNTTIGGCKYPHMCALVKYVPEDILRNSRYVRLDRPIEDSIMSLVSRADVARRIQSRQNNVADQKHNNFTVENITRLQHFLYNEREEFLADKARENSTLSISYYDLLSNPKGVVSGLCKFLGTPEANIASALKLVDPNKCHYKKEKVS